VGSTEKVSDYKPWGVAVEGRRDCIQLFGWPRWPLEMQCESPHDALIVTEHPILEGPAIEVVQGHHHGFGHSALESAITTADMTRQPPQRQAACIAVENPQVLAGHLEVE
jgi:hypothetical protein